MRGGAAESLCCGVRVFVRTHTVQAEVRENADKHNLSFDMDMGLLPTLSRAGGREIVQGIKVVIDSMHE